MLDLLLLVAYFAVIAPVTSSNLSHPQHGQVTHSFLLIVASQPHISRTISHNIPSTLIDSHHYDLILLAVAIELILSIQFLYKPEFN